MMTSSAIKQYPIKSIANSPVDKQLSAALLASVAEYLPQLHGRRIWLACSGGRDSLALAALCLQLYHQGKLPFLPQLLHVDHGLQANSKHWAMHVASWAQAQQLSCQILPVKVQGSDEQSARQARYQAMLSELNQDDVLLLAHHADDQAETVLMRLIQGAGVKGLSGMQPWRVQSQGARHHILWRPWLSVRRDTISSYAERLQLPYIDDPTNDSGDNVRSGLRCTVLPTLTAYNANVIENIARSAQLLSEAQVTVSSQAQQDCHDSAVDKLCYPSAQRVLDIDKLHTLPLYRQRQLLHYWLAQDEPLPPTKQLVDDVLTLAQREDNNHQTRLDWHAQSQSYSVLRYRQHLYRLSQDWLNWLCLPSIEPTYFLPVDFYDSLRDSSLVNIDIRKNANYRWQLKIDLANINVDRLLELSENQTTIRLKIAPLTRQQKIQTSDMGHPQAGKKLYQTLAIPVWLRNSLLVVSAVWADNTLPLLLLSPFNIWLLNDSKLLGSNTEDALSAENTWNDGIKNILRIDR